MQPLILILHVLSCISLIVLVLVQQGKGAEMGAAFGGGASNTVFGSPGASSFLFKLTAGLAVIFFVTSLSLSYIASQHEKSAQRISISQQVQQKTSLPAEQNANKTKQQTPNKL
ncbi:MAG: preprotein translocase subunit SecG [Legionellales bacterium]|nr:preprotein translocase subunit SecG [Legionellales bacterium]|tara:strand:+ start:126 stop:467 length:342 start_codon:yes stop_codon:yes gene_type:complete